MTLSQLATIFAIVTASGGLAGGGYTVFEDYRALRFEVAENTTARLLQEFERLDLIRRNRQLTQPEWLAWCSAGRRLKVFQDCPPR